MSWTFWKGSKPQLQQCLATALPQDGSNKWMQRFGPGNLEPLKKSDDTVVIEDSPEMVVSVPSPEIHEDNIEKVVEDLTDPDLDMSSKFEIFRKTCGTNPILYSNLGELLPLYVIDKLINHIFDVTGIEKQFLEHFYKYFSSFYMKRSEEYVCVEFLLKTHKIYAEYIQILLNIIIKDVDIQNFILYDFVMTLGAEDSTKIMNYLCSIELSGDEFLHNLYIILASYRSCNKTTDVQNIIFTMLKTHSEVCSTDKNYGKLLLAYLQQEQNLKTNINCNEIERVITIHKSPLKRRCLAVFERIK